MRLSINELNRYLLGDEHSRCIREGERILDADHLIENGITKITEHVVEVFGLCIQSSHIKSKPHSITGSFDIVSKELKVKNFECSCVAGKGGTCKHISALLIHCTRMDVLSYKQLSCTDVKCIWGEKKSKALDKYQPMPFLDFCCIKKPSWLKEKDPVSHENEEFCRKFLIAGSPDSNLGRHGTLIARDQSLFELTVDSDVVMKDEIQMKSEEFVQKLLEQNMEFSYEPDFLSLSDKFFFYKNVKITIDEAIALSLKTVEQNCAIWHEERSKRVTGSTCYTLFTYCSNKTPDWEKKLRSLKFAGNAATLYGQQAEKLAKDAILTEGKYSLYEVGLIVQPKAPWFGYSPDGFLLQGQEVFLLEVKCPVMGKSTTATEVVKNLPYVKVQDGQVSLKEKQKYYGQIQLGLLLTGLKNCKLIIFSSFDKTFVTINVPVNLKFSKNLFHNLSNAYFKHILPTLSFNLDL